MIGVLSRVFFVCPNLLIVLVFFERLTDFSAPGIGSKVTLLYAIGVGWIMNFYGRDFFNAVNSVTSKLKSHYQVSLFLILFFGLLLIRPGGIAPTIYFQF